MLSKQTVTNNFVQKVARESAAAFETALAGVLCAFAYRRERGSVDMVKSDLVASLIEAGVSRSRAYAHVKRAFEFVTRVRASMPNHGLVERIGHALEGDKIAIAEDAINALFIHLGINACEHVELWADGDGHPLTQAKIDAANEERKGKGKAKAAKAEAAAKSEPEAAPAPAAVAASEVIAKACEAESSLRPVVEIVVANLDVFVESLTDGEVIEMMLALNKRLAMAQSATLAEAA
jgi:hypothetical protein